MDLNTQPHLLDMANGIDSYESLEGMRVTAGNVRYDVGTALSRYHRGDAPVQRLRRPHRERAPHSGHSPAVARLPVLPPCTLDLDGNESLHALTDGVMLVRALAGLSDTAVTSGASGCGA